MYTYCNNAENTNCEKDNIKMNYNIIILYEDNHCYCFLCNSPDFVLQNGIMNTVL